MQQNKCEKCETEMIPYKNGRTIGMICPNCGWGWATTEFEPIELDQTIYTIHINTITNPSKEVLKFVSKILNANFLVTYKLLKDGQASFSGKAIEIKNIIKKLQNLEIKYSITPDFKYKI